jgi:hypothetical protein
MYAEEKFSMDEINSAITHMIKNPPLFEVDGHDGPVTQKWRGMPKLTDLIETMLELRKAKGREAVKQQEEKRQRDWLEMTKRRDEHPEEFNGPELLKSIKESYPEVTFTTGRDGVSAPAICMMPPEREEPSSQVLMNDDLANRRIEQLRKQFAEYVQKRDGAA